MTSGNLLLDALLVAMGAAVGAVARLLLGWWQTRVMPGGFPWAIWFANVIGSLLAGFVSGLASTYIFLLLGIGFCGALTTMSTFALDVAMLRAEDNLRVPKRAYHSAAPSFCTGQVLHLEPKQALEK